MSFRRSKPPASAERAPGTRATTSGHVQTSTGTAGLDAALGGGLAVGSLTLLAEDTPTAHHTHLMRLYLAQGVAHGHAVALACPSGPAGAVMTGLPGMSPGGAGGAEARRAARAGAALDIAWRYAVEAEVAGRVTAGEGSVYRHGFDLSSVGDGGKGAAVSYLGFGRSLKTEVLVEDVEAHIASAKKRGLLARVGVVGLGGGVWEGGTDAAVVHRLRVAAQRAGGVVVVTMPASSIGSGVVREADVFLRLETFGGRGAGVAGLGGEWLGVLNIDKSYRRGKGANLWVFKRGRRKYVFEIAAAAPDEEESEDEVGVKVGKGEGTLCASGPQSNKFEF